MQAVLKGASFKTQQDFHAAVKKALRLPSYYGNNLDALWDCLTSEVDTPLTLTWHDFKTSHEQLGPFAYKARRLFEQAQEEVPGFVFKAD
jgi:ribonuclease inhibitor